MIAFNFLKRLCMAIWFFFSFAAMANEPFKIFQGNYTYYSADDIFKCFEVLESPQEGAHEIPVRAVLMQKNCQPKMDCNKLERFGKIIVTENSLSFVLDHGFKVTLNSIFMEARAIYGARDGVNEVYFYVPNIKFKCTP